MRAFAINFTGTQPTFKTIQTDVGTFPTANGPNDILSIIGSAGVTTAGNAITKTVTISFNSSSVIGGPNRAVQFNDSGSFGGDARFYFDKLTADIVMENAELTIVPKDTSTPCLLLNTPTGFAAPALNITNNGSQTAYVSGLGDTFFQQVTANAGVSTDNLGPRSSSAISVSGDFLPNNDSTYFVGTQSLKWLSVYSENVGTHQMLNTGGTGQFYFDSGVMKMQVDLDMNGQTILNYTPPAPPTPGLGTVLSASADANAINITNLANIYTNTPGSYDIGQTSSRFNNGFFITVEVQTLSTQTGEINLGTSVSDTLRFTAGDNGGSPTNPVTPSSWIHARNSSGADGYVPFYNA